MGVLRSTLMFAIEALSSVLRDERSCRGCPPLRMTWPHSSHRIPGKMCKQCAASEFEAQRCASTQDRVCKPCGSCAEGSTITPVGCQREAKLPEGWEQLDDTRKRRVPMRISRPQAGYPGFQAVVSIGMGSPYKTMTVRKPESCS